METEVWVDPAGEGPEDATELFPFNTLLEALTYVVQDGTGVVKLAVGDYPGPLVLNTPARFEAAGGVVRIGE